MQGIRRSIATDLKIDYLNALLRVGFHTLDFGSFVSPKAVPQMADTAKVLAGLELDGIATRLLAIVANERGAEDAVQYDEIAYLGYPFSISETFQRRNTNAGIEASMGRVEAISKLAQARGKELVLYLSMAFGNPYGDPWSVELAIEHSHRLYERIGVKIIALSDTIGSSSAESIEALFKDLIPALPDIEIGAHLHSTPQHWREKLEAAYNAGCRRFDGALKGYGGCPMAREELTGNMPTESMLSYFAERQIPTGVNEEALAEALMKSNEVFA